MVQEGDVALLLLGRLGAPARLFLTPTRMLFWDKMFSCNIKKGLIYFNLCMGEYQWARFQSMSTPATMLVGRSATTQQIIMCFTSCSETSGCSRHQNKPVSVHAPKKIAVSSISNFIQEWNDAVINLKMFEIWQFSNWVLVSICWEICWNLTLRHLFLHFIGHRVSSPEENYN